MAVGKVANKTVAKRGVLVVGKLILDISKVPTKLTSGQPFDPLAGMIARDTRGKDLKNRVKVFPLGFKSLLTGTVELTYSVVDYLGQNIVAKTSVEVVENENNISPANPDGNDSKGRANVVQGNVAIAPELHRLPNTRD